MGVYFHMKRRIAQGCDATILAGKPLFFPERPWAPQGQKAVFNPDESR
jgi:hypothetical protein